MADCDLSGRGMPVFAIPHVHLTENGALEGKSPHGFSSA